METESNKITSTQIIGEATEATPRILVVDDDIMIRKLLEQILTTKGYDVDLAADSGDALEKMIDYKYNLLLLDAKLPGISGHELLKYCKKHHLQTEIIMITGNPELDAAVSTVKDGAFDYIAKPFSVEKLLERVSDALKAQKEKLLKEILRNDGGVAEEQLLPDYKIIKTLGAGNMGVVLLVEKDQCYFAMKILRKDSDDNVYRARVQRFLREAKVLSQISHPNIVSISSYGYPKGKDVPYILMEYIEGLGLTQLIKEQTLILEDKLRIISQVASALGAVHKHGILHRDVKPSNVLISKEFHAKLTDFGVARISDSSLTMTYEVLGSPAYMPPENFDQKIPIDQRSDIFSLGVLSYELVTGHKPFHGETVVQMMSAIKTSRPLEPRHYVPKLPLKVQDIVAKMLQKNPEDRFQTAEEIVQAINTLNNAQDNSDPITKKIFRGMFQGARVWE